MDQDDQHLVKQSLTTIKKLQARLAEVTTRSREPIAIVGSGLRFPGGAVDATSFWQLLDEGRDAVVQTTRRWADAPVTRTLGGGWAGLLDDVAGFDAAFFGISPREANLLDPQQRLLLELVWEALEDAAIPPSALHGGKAGVFVGIGANDYRERVIDSAEAYAATGNGNCFAAGRLSYFLGAQGPCLAVDTACSSSLTAIHLACQSLRAGECDVALAGGVSLILSATIMQAYFGLQALSPDGRCKTFDATANGFVRGEGGCMMALKRLSDAQRDGNPILALIRGSAVNQDGRSSGLTAPNVLAQQALLRQSLENAGVSASSISYIEAHGTGTLLGDPIEVDALNSVFGQDRSEGRVCTMGSVKSNIGHLEAAAGVAGLMKIVLAFEYEKIPASLHFKTLNPHIDLSASALQVAATPAPWPQRDQPRRATVSSFGLSGTNANVIVEEPPAPVPRSMPAAEHWLVVLSGRDAAALKEQAERLCRHLSLRPALTLAEVSMTLIKGRQHLPERAALVVSSAAEAAEQLTALAAGELPSSAVRGHVARSPQVGFLFTGQGSQYPGMGQVLYRSSMVFREALDRCASAASGLERPLLEVMFPEPGKPTPLSETRYAQPALFALGFALSEFWRASGVLPLAALGHSVGEFVAAVVAGVLDVEDAMRLVVERGRLMQTVKRRGGMLAVFAEEARVCELVANESLVTIAAANGPVDTTLSGDRNTLLNVAKLLKERGIESRPLTVSHAFHSADMDEILDAFERVVSDVKLRDPQIPLISNVTGRIAAPGEVTTPRYWRAQLRQAVRFGDGVRAMQAEGIDTFIECGPGKTLSDLGRANIKAGVLFVPSLLRNKDDCFQLLQAQAALFCQGIVSQPQAFAEARTRVPFVRLPTYAFQRDRYWVEDPEPRESARVADVGHPLLGPQRDGGDANAWIFEKTLGERALRLLREHRVHGTMVLPGTAYLEVALAAGASLGGPVTLEDVIIAQPLVVDDGTATRLRVEIVSEAADQRAFTIRSQRITDRQAGDGLAWTTHARGKMKSRGVSHVV